jgi:hypothetical protein
MNQRTLLYIVGAVVVVLILAYILGLFGAAEEEPAPITTAPPPATTAPPPATETTPPATGTAPAQ